MSRQLTSMLQIKSNASIFIFLLASNMIHQTCLIESPQGLIYSRIETRFDIYGVIYIKFIIRHCVRGVRIRSYSGPYSPAVGLNTERYGVCRRIQSECEKMRTRITPNTDTFHAVRAFKFFLVIFFLRMKFLFRHRGNLKTLMPLQCLKKSFERNRRIGKVISSH